MSVLDIVDDPDFWKQIKEKQDRIYWKFWQDRGVRINPDFNYKFNNAEYFDKKGYKVVPLEPGTKNPNLKNRETLQKFAKKYPKAGWKYSDSPFFFWDKAGTMELKRKSVIMSKWDAFKDHGIGIEMGYGLLCIDADLTDPDESYALCEEILTKFPESENGIWMTSDGIKFAVIFRSDLFKGKKKIKKQSGHIEILGKGFQKAISMFIDGEQYYKYARTTPDHYNNIKELPYIPVSRINELTEVEIPKPKTTMDFISDFYDRKKRSLEDIQNILAESENRYHGIQINQNKSGFIETGSIGPGDRFYLIVGDGEAIGKDVLIRNCLSEGLKKDTNLKSPCGNYNYSVEHLCDFLSYFPKHAFDDFDSWLEGFAMPLKYHHSGTIGFKFFCAISKAFLNYDPVRNQKIWDALSGSRSKKNISIGTWIYISSLYGRKKARSNKNAIDSSSIELFILDLSNNNSDGNHVHLWKSFDEIKGIYHSWCQEHNQEILSDTLLGKVLRKRFDFRRYSRKKELQYNLNSNKENKS